MGSFDYPASLSCQDKIQRYRFCVEWVTFLNNNLRNQKENYCFGFCFQWYTDLTSEALEPLCKSYLNAKWTMELGILEGMSGSCLVHPAIQSSGRSGRLLRISSSFDRDQGWRFWNLSGQLFQDLTSLMNNFFLYIVETRCVLTCPLAHIVLAAVLLWEKSNSIFLTQLY